MLSHPLHLEVLMLRDRARFVVSRPALLLLPAVAVVAIVLDWVLGPRSVVAAAGLLVLVGWALEWVFASSRRTDRAEAEANARWALNGLMTERRAWPSMGGWALAPSAVTEWIRRVSMFEQPQVVELGPGSSTLLLARGVPSAQVHAVEHDPFYASHIRSEAGIAGLDGITVVDAPLAEDGWYADEAVRRLPERVDALLVDGPPNWDGEGRRSPAVRIIDERMGPGGLVLVDDAHRRDERSMVRTWVREGKCRVLLDAGSYVLLERV